MSFGLVQNGAVTSNHPGLNRAKNTLEVTTICVPVELWVPSPAGPFQSRGVTTSRRAVKGVRYFTKGGCKSE